MLVLFTRMSRVRSLRALTSPGQNPAVRTKVYQVADKARKGRRPVVYGRAALPVVWEGHGFTVKPGGSFTSVPHASSNSCWSRRAPLKSAWFRLASLRMVMARSAPLRFARVRLALCRLARQGQKMKQ
jgi:hypothetical protein